MAGFKRQCMQSSKQGLNLTIPTGEVKWMNIHEEM